MSTLCVTGKLDFELHIMEINHIKTGIKSSKSVNFPNANYIGTNINIKEWLVCRSWLFNCKFKRKMLRHIFTAKSSHC